VGISLSQALFLTIVVGMFASQSPLQWLPNVPSTNHDDADDVEDDVEDDTGGDDTGDDNSVDDNTPVPPKPGMRAACPPAEVPPAGFTDVAPGNVHAAAIDCIAWRKITVGRTPTTYEPAGPITRGQMASILTRALTAMGQQLPEQPHSAFIDTPGTTHALAIDQLAELEIVVGRADGTYGPGSAVTRAQVATSLVRTFEHIAFELEPDRDYFVDDESSVHERSFSAAGLAGLTVGVDGERFGPDDALRRDQMATFVSRLLDLAIAEGAALRDD
jgi:hypothetical protein